MKKNKRIYLVVLSHFFGSILIFAQSYSQKVSYETYQSTFYDYGLDVDFNSISPNEIILNYTSEIKDIHTEYITDEGEYIHEIEHKFNNVYPTWMIHPVKTIIDENGATSYDNLGNTLVNFPHNSSNNEKVKITELFPIPNFNPIDKNLDIKEMIDLMRIKISLDKNMHEITNITDDSNSFKINENGLISLKSNDKELLIDLKEKYIAEIHYDSDKNETYRLDRTFKSNEKGIESPNEKVEVYHLETENRIKYKKIVYTSYTNYKKDINEMSVGKKDIIISNIKIYPNPAMNTLFLDIPSNVKDDPSQVTISVYNVVGKLVLLNNENTAGKTISLDINNLASGVYTVQTSLEGITTTTKIVKQ